MQTASHTPIDAADDFRNLRLGDARLDSRLASIAVALQQRPTETFPKAMGSDAASEAFYRFISNDKVEWQSLLDAHVGETRARVAAVRDVLAIHDTTLCQFGGDSIREGAFRTAKEKSGFLAHTCLAVSADGSRQPLGLLGMLPVVRLPLEEAASTPALIYQLESQRWLDLVAVVEDEKDADVELTHVMDSEGDTYDLLEFMVERKADFVVRLCQNRRVLTVRGDDCLEGVLQGAVTRLTRKVRLSARKQAAGKNPGKRHLARDERSTVLEVRVLQTNLLRPSKSEAFLAGLRVNIVHVIEADPPADMEPVSWVLATTRPVDTAEQIEWVVDAYRARWLIEEWFKALKTGCAYEQRQLESLDALLVVFSLLAPVASRLLSIRWFARNEPDRPATDVLSRAEIACLRLLESKHRRALPQNPSVAQVMLAIARMGGFLTQNKTPGWQVLGRGFQDFLNMFSMYQLMKGAGEEM